MDRGKSVGVVDRWRDANPKIAQMWATQVGPLVWGKEKGGPWHRLIRYGVYDFAKCRNRKGRFIGTCVGLPPFTSGEICPACRMIAAREIVEGP